MSTRFDVVGARGRAERCFSLFSVVLGVVLVVLGVREREGGREGESVRERERERERERVCCFVFGGPRGGFGGPGNGFRTGSWYWC